jgi:hypothetical protein
MKTLKISDELYEQLKTFIVDPFDDTPDVVLGRLMEIATKAKKRWSPLETRERPEHNERAGAPQREPAREAREPLYEQVEQEIIL